MGYVDVGILFSVGLDEVCLLIECKRLNVNGASLAADYVCKGMMRFVTGKYGPDLPVAAMIGYVMDGQVPKASDSVIKQIRKQLAALCSLISDLFHRTRSIQYQPHQKAIRYRTPASIVVSSLNTGLTWRHDGIS